MQITWVSRLSQWCFSMLGNPPQIPAPEKCLLNPQNLKKKGLSFHKRCKKGHVETEELYPAPLMYTNLKKKCQLLLRQSLDTRSTTQELAGQTKAQAVFWVFRWCDLSGTHPTLLLYCQHSHRCRQHGCIPVTLHPQKQAVGHSWQVPGLDLDLGLLYRKTSSEGQTAIKA